MPRQSGTRWHAPCLLLSSPPGALPAAVVVVIIVAPTLLAPVVKKVTPDQLQITLKPQLALNMGTRLMRDWTQEWHVQPVPQHRQHSNPDLWQQTKNADEQRQSCGVCQHAQNVGKQQHRNRCRSPKHKCVNHHRVCAELCTKADSVISCSQAAGHAMQQFA